MSAKRKPAAAGRAALFVSIKEINPVRQIGRWTDEQWDIVRKAADQAGTSVAAWARGVLLRAAGRWRS